MERSLAVDEDRFCCRGMRGQRRAGHLCTMMNAHFSAAVPNLRIMETDIDRLPWDHELFTHVPEIENGHLIMPERPGWGTEPNEDALRAHPPQGNVGLLNYGQKA